MSQLTVDPKTAALVVMDFQTAIVEMVATEKDALLTRRAKLVQAARKAGMRVIYIVVGYSSRISRPSWLTRRSCISCR
jgi:nicotinamidase-related amidase